MSDESGWSRRGILSPRGLGAAAGGFFGAVIPEPALPVERSFGRWCIARRAMACEFSVFLPDQMPNPALPGEAALDVIDETEELLTVFSASSAVSYVNQHAADEAVRVDAPLYDLLERAAALSQQTHGAFDVAAGALTRVWGFLHGPKRVPTDAERTAALACSGMTHVTLDAATRSVRFDRAGVELNFGSIGKGYAIDRAMGRLREAYGIECALMQGGLSSLVAMGSPAGDDGGWLVGIQNPFNSEQRLATVRLRNRAMGTSGAANQYFEADGRRYGHVLDPRTGWPADELASVSVVAADGATADALATALFVLGLDKAADFCKDNRNIGAVLVYNAERGASLGECPRLVTFNLPAEDVDLRPASGESV